MAITGVIRKAFIKRVGTKKNQTVIMANNNHYVVVNATGELLNTTINGESAMVDINGYSAWMQFPSTGETISIDIEMNGSTANQSITVNGGVDSYTIIQFCNNGWINIFPSSVNERVSI